MSLGLYILGLTEDIPCLFPPWGPIAGYLFLGEYPLGTFVVLLVYTAKLLQVSPSV